MNRDSTFYGSREHSIVNRDHRLESLLGSTVLFAATALIAITLLTTALIIFISDLFGSLLLAMTTIGLVALVCTLVIYFGVVRPRIHTFIREMDEVYNIVNQINTIYRKIKNFFALFF